MRFRTLAVALLCVVAPALAAAQTVSPVSLHLAAGTQLNGGGTSVAASLGYALTPRFTLLGGAERNYVPSRVDYYDSGYGATRGGTLQFVSGELRAGLLPAHRISPYVLAGFGVGTSRPNVNQLFPDQVRNNLRVFFTGGGVRMRLAPHLDLIGDTRLAIGAENDDVALSLPIRAGIVWTF